jgi:hypothetical protein
MSTRSILFNPNLNLNPRNLKKENPNPNPNPRNLRKENPNLNLKNPKKEKKSFLETNHL